MSKLMDREYLQTDQYKNASNLDARIELHKRFSTNEYGWQRWVFARFDLSEGCDLLDVGCGPGDLWLDNADRISPSWNVTLSDFSAGMVRQARGRLAASRSFFNFGVLDVQAIPFPDGRFDVVIANHVLFHVPHKASAFSEIRRVLRPGGRFYASTVGQTHLQEMHQLIRRFDPDAGSEERSPVASFLLENGLAQIAQWFSGVDLHRYEDGLSVTEAEPLVAYILSIADGRLSADDKRAALADFVEQELASRGSIYITKDSGLFEAWK